MGKFWETGPEFTEVPQTESEASEADMEAQAMLPKSLARERKPSCWRRLALGALYFAAGITLGAYVGSCYAAKAENLDRKCIEHISEFSPVVKEVDITFSEKHFNGSLFYTNKFRQDAGPEVDEAWESLGVDYRAAIVPTELAAASGLDPSFVQVNPKYGGGYPANVEGLHHLHCLNLLRQSLHYNFDYYHKLGQGAFKNDDNVLKHHITHCLDALRQVLMCNVDVGVLGQVWWNKKEPQAYPDFNTKHMCRNFEKVRAWAEAHQAPDEVPDDYLAPPINEAAVYPSIP